MGMTCLAAFLIVAGLVYLIPAAHVGLPILALAAIVIGIVILAGR